MAQIDLPDPLAGVCAYLRSSVGRLLDPIPGGINLPAGLPAVFRPELPPVIDAFMPLGCIVVRPAGGYTQFGKGTIPMADPRVDFTCYADNPTRAHKIAQSVAYNLMQLTFPQTWEDTVLYSAQVHSGPVPLPDTQTLWPAVWLSGIVLHGQLPAPAL